MGEVIWGTDFRPHEKPIGPLDTAVLVFADEDTAPCEMPPAEPYCAPKSDPA